MPRPFIVFASLLLSSMPALAAPATSAQIEQLERDRQQAFMRGDVAALDAATAEDYTTINFAGKISDKPQMMQSLRAAKIKVLSVTLDDLKARIYGDTAVLTGVYNDHSIADGVAREVHVRFTRVFVRDGDRWRAVAYQQTAMPEK